MTAQLWLAEAPTWYRIDKFLSDELIEFVDDHYSRQTPGSDQILPPGETLLLQASAGIAVWGVVHNFDPGQDDTKRWRCSIFRNVGGGLSSLLIMEATAMTLDYWPRHYGWPSVPLTTEVDPNKTRRKRDPGRCFRRAGWELWSKLDLFVFIAPGERARVGLQGPVCK